MRKDRFQSLLTFQLEQLKKLTATKGKEYTNNESSGAADQHANFYRQAQELGLTPEQVLGVYLNKHLDAVKSFIKTGAVLSEPIEGRIDDAILYLILLRGLVIDRQEAAEPEATARHIGNLVLDGASRN
ncbi:MAG: hypothetical protein E6R08_06235 [Nevskiaceae bacterium]|nr:MAG: hypothetical protein E6R08_06235 [Nevskiaceae bacterium]